MADFFHVYCDETSFRYEVVLTRDDEDAGNVGQKYVLYVSAVPSAALAVCCSLIAAPSLPFTH